MALLEVRDLNVSYGAIRALHGVSFHVNEGEVVTLIGANGAGKSTTLRTISGLLPVTSGEVSRIARSGERAEARIDQSLTVAAHNRVIGMESDDRVRVVSGGDRCRRHGRGGYRLRFSRKRGGAQPVCTKLGVAVGDGNLRGKLLAQPTDGPLRQAAGIVHR